MSPDKMKPPCRMRRLLIAVAAVPILVHGRASPRFHIACLSSSRQSTTAFDAFQAAFGAHDPAMAVQVRFTHAFADFDPQRLRHLALKLDAADPDLILCFDFDAAQAVLSARGKTEIPVVFRAHDDPVKRGLVDSYSRPGRGMTGITTFRCIDDKLVEIMRDALPAARRIGFMRDASIPDGGCHVKAQEYARKRGVELLDYSVSAQTDLPALLARIGYAKPDAVIVSATAITWNGRRDVIAKMDALALPALYEAQVFVDDGGLMYFGAVQSDAYMRLARAVAHVLRGGKAGEFPVSRPVQFELLINFKAKHAHSYALSAEILRRADRILE